MAINQQMKKHLFFLILYHKHFIDLISSIFSFMAHTIENVFRFSITLIKFYPMKNCYAIWLITYRSVILIVAYIIPQYVWHKVYNYFSLDVQGDNSVLLFSFIICSEMKTELVVVWSTGYVAKMKSLRHQGLERGPWIPEVQDHH